MGYRRNMGFSVKCGHQTSIGIRLAYGIVAYRPTVYRSLILDVQ